MEKWGRIMINKRIEIIEGDITLQKVDGIVNAANSSLLGGGGVDGAIHRAAGKELLKECKEIRKTRLTNGLPTGEAVLTKGYDLWAKYVVHTVGPVWRGGNKNEPELLANCYSNCLKIAEAEKLRSIAFPAISTGIYSYPLEPAAKIAFSETSRFLENSKYPGKVIFVVIGENVAIYKKIAA